jgi:hypothetical protein
MLRTAKRQREMKYSESATIITRSKDRSNHLGTLKDRDNPSVTQEGHVVSLVVSLARGKKCFGAVVPKLISNHSLHMICKNRMANQNLQNLAQKILRKMNLQLDDDTKDDRRSAADEETSLGIQIREIGRFLEQKINPERII